MINYKLIVLIFISIMLSKSGYYSSNSPFINVKTPSVEQKELTENQTEDGKAIYMKYCMSCHQIDGSGVPNMYPPLQKSDWVNGDKKRFISAVINGIQGEIEVNGEIYSQVMPKQDYLTNDQISKVLSFVRQNFGNKAAMITPKDVESLRPKKQK
jgi:mono/diheme cytochrome c family protein